MTLWKVGAALAVTLVLLPSTVGCSGQVAQRIDHYETATQEELQIINLDAGYFFGSETAPVTIVEYASYECRDCANLHVNISEKLQEHINQGVVYYVFKPIDHPKFPNDLEINLRFAPRSLREIGDAFKRFDSYTH